MEPDTVLGKTAAGAAVLDGHEGDLPRTLRHALILVDGRSTVAKLEQRGAMIPDFPAALRELVARGLVAPVAGGAPAGSATGRQALSAALIGAAQAILGDKAGKVVKKLEDAGGSREELSAAVEACYKLIRLTIDEARAEEFRKAAKDFITRHP
jgi:hypothetical protein